LLFSQEFSCNLVEAFDSTFCRDAASISFQTAADAAVFFSVRNQAACVSLSDECKNETNHSFFLILRDL